VANHPEFDSAATPPGSVDLRYATGGVAARSHRL